MSVLDPTRRRVIEAGIEESRLIDVKLAAESDPKALIAEMTAFDPQTVEYFNFTMFDRESDPFWPYKNKDRPGYNAGWLWQGEMVDWWMDPYESTYLILKARQLGITWLAMGMAVWYMLFRPGATTVAYSYTEDEAKKLVTSAWTLFKSLPLYLRDQVTVITPTGSKEPGEWIRLQHKKSGLLSTLQAMTATPKAGHGERVTWGVMDEVARMDNARGIYTALSPAATSRRRADGTVTGKLAMISTANGVGDPETGAGNYFYIAYATRKEKKIAFKFLPWNLEPSRDAQWYQDVAMKLDEVERNQQYPLNETDAFMLSGRMYFNRQSMAWYRANTRDPLFSGQFRRASTRRAEWITLRDGVLDIFAKPVSDHKYAIAVDAATGKGTDYTAAGVIDLETAEIVAELHGKMEAPRAAYQLHYLGRWYNDAKIAVETQGGYGEAIIYSLREGTSELPVYPNLYRYVDYGSSKKTQSEQYGIPMGPKTRAQVVEGLADWIRQRQFPYLSVDTVRELGTFVHADTNPTPRAQEGTNDDRVLMLGIAARLFGEFGTSPHRPKKWKKAKYNPPPTKSGV